MNTTMPRPPSENTFQITFKVPDEWIEKADALATAMSRPGLTITRTDALRQALARGLEALHAEHVKSSRGRK
jgi:predicted transcriptional regulator